LTPISLVAQLNHEQSGILSSVLNRNNFSKIAKKAHDGPVTWSIRTFLETVKEHQKKTFLRRKKNNSIFAGFMSLQTLLKSKQIFKYRLKTSVTTIDLPL
jgi:hypothetical protein